MFEALFILTTIDTGTRVGRFLVQEFLGKAWAPLGRTDGHAAAILATSLVVGGWTAFLLTGSVQTIWPMFGIANQLLAVIALTAGTSMILRTRGPRYALVTFAPMLFVGTVTITAGIQGIRRIYWPLTRSLSRQRQMEGWVDTLFTSLLLCCVVLVLAYATTTWRRVLRERRAETSSGPLRAAA